MNTIAGVASPTPVPCETSCASCDVRALSLCAALRQDDLSAMEQVSTVRNLAPDEILIHEGDPARRVYTLTRGMLRLSTILADGRRQITAACDQTQLSSRAHSALGRHSGRRPPSRMKAMISGGAPLTPEVGVFFQSLGVTFLPG